MQERWFILIFRVSSGEASSWHGRKPSSSGLTERDQWSAPTNCTWSRYVSLSLLSISRTSLTRSLQRPRLLVTLLRDTGLPLCHRQSLRTPRLQSPLFLLRQRSSHLHHLRRKAMEAVPCRHQLRQSLLFLLHQRSRLRHLHRKAMVPAPCRLHLRRKILFLLHLSSLRAMVVATFLRLKEMVSRIDTRIYFPLTLDRDVGHCCEPSLPVLRRCHEELN